MEMHIVPKEIKIMKYRCAKKYRFAFLARQFSAAVLALLALLAAAQRSPAQKADPGTRGHAAKYLYIWAGDQARLAPDFITVINFDESSKDYGKILKTAAVPTSGNEAHHMHLSADGNIIAAGGLLSLLKRQDGIFFFDVSTPDNPHFLKATSAPFSAITDDFYPLPGGGFLITQMGSNTGGAPGRLAEFDAGFNLVAEWPQTPPADGFNPHGISVRPEINLLVTSDFVNPVSTLVGFPGGPQVRGAIRVWNLATRNIVRSIFIPTALGTMDVKLIPGDRLGRALTAGMFDGLIYLVDTQAGTYKPVFDPAAITGAGVMGMPQILAVTQDGTRLIFPLLGTGQIVMLDISNPEKPFVLSIIDLGAGAQPHDIDLTEDNKRLVVTDYFLNEDAAGVIHFEGDHKVYVLQVQRRTLQVDTRFQLDFNTAFPTGPARPHGIASK
jgi:56kDa selenium binding protein (SBP56)